MENKLKTALLERKLSLGAWIQIGHPACAEIFAEAGFDWICVDLEHGAIGIETMTNIFRTIDAFDSVPVARLPINDPVWICRTLDAGARGLIIPMVKTAEEAEFAISKAKYPPRGERGYGYSRANLHGIDFENYITTANEEIAIIAQIEHKDGIDNLESILQVPDVDGVFIGPLDLSGSYGKVGQLECPEMIDAMQRYLNICEKHKKSAGMHIVRPNQENIQDALNNGYTLLALGLDNVFVETGARSALQAAGR